MAYRDCLDWVGEGYSIAGFAAEAEKRGCCRKVSGWAPWLEPGNSRVFLAHRGGMKPLEKGVIFGYYELAGADVVMSPVTGAEALRLGAAAKEQGGQEQLRDFWEAELSTSLGPGKPDTKKPPRSKPDPARDDLVDFLVDLLIDCDQPPIPIPGGNGVTTVQASLEEERWCGFRPFGEPPSESVMADPDFWWRRQSAVYLVDGLARGIDDLLCELLKELIKEELKNRGRSSKSLKETQRELLSAAGNRSHRGGRGKKPRRRGAKIFDQAVEQAAAKGGFAPSVPRGLKRHCELRGGLVLFDTPYPVYYQLPRAHFRGYLRIDGDDLLDQITAYYGGGEREIELPFFIDDTRPLAWPSTIALLAKRTGMGKAQTHRVLDSLTELITEELAADQDGSHALRISGLGTFSTRPTKARTGRNPSTGKPIKIPAGRRIRFSAAAPLKRRVKG